MRAVVLQHVSMEGPARVADRCAARGIEVDVRHLYAGDPVPTALADDELLVVMGGGMGVGDREDARYPYLKAEIALLRSAVSSARPILGICLGAQLLAHAAGARVYPQVTREPSGAEVRVREVGWAPVRFLGTDRERALSGLDSEAMVLHWHGDTFDLPVGAVHLATSALCANQAFRLGARAFGLQFHVEVEADTARRWAREDEEFVRAALGPAGPELIITQTGIHALAARAAGDRLIDNILDCMTS